MATLFAFATYLGALVVIGVICFGLGRFEPKYGVEGSFLVMAVVFAIFLPVAALGFYLAKRGLGHTGRTVVLAGLVSGIAGTLLVLLCDWIFASQLGAFLLPLICVFAAGYASARLAESGAKA